MSVTVVERPLLVAPTLALSLSEESSPLPTETRDVQPRVSHHFGVSPELLEQLAARFPVTKKCEVSDCYHDTSDFVLAKANCYLRIRFEVPEKATPKKVTLSAIKASRKVVLIRVKSAHKGFLTCDELSGDSDVTNYLSMHNILSPVKPKTAFADDSIEFVFPTLFAFAVCDSTRTTFKVSATESVHVDYFALHYGQKQHYYLLGGCHHSSPAEWKASNISSILLRLGATENVRSKAEEILYRSHSVMYTQLVNSGKLASSYAEHNPAEEPFQFKSPLLAQLAVPQLI